jgi:6-phosphogluconate dehydrogenase
MMLPAGEATESLYKQVLPLLAPGDILIDGGNAHFEDTHRRHDESFSKQVKYLGIGVSGGVIAVSEGYALMAGGNKEAYGYITPVLDTLAAPRGGHTYVGAGGAGHFVKMVHNGVEYVYMQALGEGFGVLSKSPYDLDLLAVAKLYQRGSLLSGFMLDRTVEALAPDPTLSTIVGVVAASGEAQWTVDQAKKEGVPVDFIEKALAYRVSSQSDPSIQQSYTAKLIAALRNAFGGHEVKREKV